MRSKQQNKLRRRISRRHKGGKPLEQLKAQVEDALQKIRDVESVLQAVMDELTSAEEEPNSDDQSSLGPQRGRSMGMSFPSLDTPQGMVETPTTQGNRRALRDSVFEQSSLGPQRGRSMGMSFPSLDTPQGMGETPTTQGNRRALKFGVYDY